MPDAYNWFAATSPTEHRLSPSELSRYLARIGLAAPAPGAAASPALLCALVRAHALSIPFENLDVALTVPVSLAPADLLSKLVDRNRGGFCLEMNGLLSYALQTLGYTVRLRHARVWLRHAAYTPREPPHPRQHQVLVVRCAAAAAGGGGGGGKGGEEDASSDFLVDVGFGGGGPAEPLPLRAGGPPVRTAGDLFRLDAGGAGEDTHILWGCQAGAWKRLYSFEHRSLDVPIVHAADFLLCSFFVQRARGHYFITLPFATLPTADGRLTLMRRELRRKSAEREGEPAAVDVTPVRDAAHLRALLLEIFAVSLDLAQAQTIFDTEFVS